MRILLVSATNFEIEETDAWLANHDLGFNTLEAKLLISGIGQLQTAWSLQNRIRMQPPNLVIQAGIGGTQSAVDLGKVFAIRSDTIGDLGVMETTGFQSIFDMGLAVADRFPFQNGKLENPYTAFLRWTGLELRDGVTVNEIRSADAAGFQRKSAPYVESMEGAALHYVCLMEKIPFLQIRAVSNVLGDRDKSRWKFKESRTNLHQVLVALIQKLEKTDETLFRI